MVIGLDIVLKVLHKLNISVEDGAHFCRRAREIATSGRLILVKIIIREGN